MFINENNFPKMVLTTKGLISNRNIEIGDKLIEYVTGAPLEIIGIKCQEFDKIYTVSYNDSRTEMYTKLEPIFIGDKYEYPINCIKNNPYYYKQSKIEFDIGVRRPLIPDPYIAGALLISGDIDDEYINISRDSSMIISYMKNVYKCKAKSSKDRIYFQRDHYINPLTWGDLFRNTNFYNIDYPKGIPGIIQRYLYASTFDRIKFVRGAFDALIDKEEKNYIRFSIPGNIYTNNIRWLRWILWSLGVLNKIFHTTEHECYLEIIGKYDNYPGLFYDIAQIEGAIRASNYVIDSVPKIKLHITDIVEDESIGFVKEFYLEKPHACYLSEKFIPRISL